MRIFGYVLLILGILFSVLFVVAELGGGHIGVIPFFVSFLLITMGWTLRTSAKGILQQDPAGKHAAAGGATPVGQAGTANGEFSTIELPLTPEVAAVIVRQNTRTQKILLYVAGGFIVFFALLSAVLSATIPGQGHILLPLFGGIGLTSALLIYGITWMVAQRPLRKDLRGTIYLRTTGPVQVVRMSSGGMLRLADRAFLMDRRNGMTELSNLGWGTVDYIPHGHMILGAWDWNGRIVYSLPGYGTGSGA